MAKQHPFSKKPGYGKRLALSAVPDISTARGSSKENDEMRRIQMFANDLSEKFDALQSTPETPATTSPNKPTTATPEKPVTTTASGIVTLHNGKTIVDPTFKMNYIDNVYVEFIVTKSGTTANVQAYRPLTVQADHNSIRSHTPYATDTVKTIDFVSSSGTHGVRFSGYYESQDRVAITASSTYNLLTAYKYYDGGTARPQFDGDPGYVVGSGTTALYFMGDADQFEGDQPSMSGSGKSYPTLSVTSILAQKQPWWISPGSYPSDGNTTMIRYRVRPLLRVVDSDGTSGSSNFTTRIFLKPGSGITLHAAQEDPVSDGAWPGGTDPRNYAAKVWADLNPGAITIENLGISGTNIGEVYKTYAGNTYYLRRVKAVGDLYITEDANYITISGNDHRYTVANIGGGVPIYRDTTLVAGFNQHNLYTLVAGANITISGSPTGIVISGLSASGTGATYDIDTVGSGEGVIYKDKTIGSPTIFHTRSIKQDRGIEVSTDIPNDIVKIKAKDDAYVFQNVGTDVGHVLKSVRHGWNGSVKTYTSLSSGTGSYANGTYSFETTGGAGAGCTVVATFYAGSIISMTIDDPGEGYLVGDTLSLIISGFSVAPSFTVATLWDDRHIVSLKTISASGDLNIEDRSTDILTKFSIFSHSLGGFPIYDHKTSVSGTVDLYYKGLVGAGSVTVYSGTNYLTVSGTDHTYAITNVGSGYQWYKDTASGVPDVFNLRTITAVGNLTAYYSPSNNEVVISGSPSVYAMANVGAGTGLSWRDTISGTFNIRTIQQGLRTVVTTSGNVIVIDGWDYSAVASGSCIAMATPYNMYMNTVTGTNSKTFAFRNFGVSNDIGLLQCGNGGYMFNVDIQGTDVGSGISIYDGKDGYDGVKSTLRFKTIVGVGGVSVDYDFAGTTILVSGTMPIYYSFTNDGSGYPVYNGQTGSGTQANPWVEHFKSMVAGSGIQIVSGTNTLTFNNDRFWTFQNIGTGSGVWASTTGSGTVANPYLVSLKSMIAGSGIGIAATASGLTFTASGNTLTASGAGIQNVGTSTLQFADTSYDTYWTHLPVGSDSKMQPHFKNYNTSFDTPYFVSGTTTVIEKTIPGASWENVYFSSMTLTDAAGFVIQDTHASPSFKFKPTLPSRTYIISVHLAVHARNPISFTQTSVLNLPEIALFRNGAFWRQIDVDKNSSTIGALRDALIVANTNTPIAGWVTPNDNASDVYLNGTALVRLTPGDELSVYFRHNGPTDRLVHIDYGFIDISGIGEDGPISTAAMTWDVTSN